MADLFVDDGPPSDYQAGFRAGIEAAAQYLIDGAGRFSDIREQPIVLNLWHLADLIRNLKPEPSDD